jgi:hypothetical protein
MNGNKKLGAPPIVEVVCGLFFAPIPELDPIAVGKLWHDLRGEYPQHTVQPPVVDQVGLMLAPGAGPLRSWFISPDDEWIIQIQYDRFYLNWRKREGSYPRFNDDGKERGVLSRALAEFERFSKFCDEAFEARPNITRADVAKVDLLVQGEHWQDTADLATLMPIVRALRAHAKTDSADFTAQIAETRPACDVIVGVHCGMQSIFGMLPTRGVRIETRAHRAVDAASPDPRTNLAELNAELNDVFFGLFESKELTRFGGLG